MKPKEDKAEFSGSDSDGSSSDSDDEESDDGGKKGNVKDIMKNPNDFDYIKPIS
jgi:hypothetical protein